MILNLHSPAFPRLSDAMYRILCSPAEFLSPGRFLKCIMSGTAPELSVAVGGVQVTDVDVLPRSAVAIIFWEQFENIGPRMSVESNKHFDYLFIYFSLWVVPHWDRAFFPTPYYAEESEGLLAVYLPGNKISGIWLAALFINTIFKKMFLWITMRV